ncbi:unnamed protein product [Tenebrio molitor]|nr:unnamed protein product [Tenebrio molitor]
MRHGAKTKTFKFGKKANFLYLVSDKIRSAKNSSLIVKRRVANIEEE